MAGGNWSSSQCLYQYELYPSQPAQPRSLLPLTSGWNYTEQCRHFTPQTEASIRASSAGPGAYKFGGELSLILFIKIGMLGSSKWFHQHSLSRETIERSPSRKVYFGCSPELLNVTKTCEVFVWLRILVWDCDSEVRACLYLAIGRSDVSQTVLLSKNSNLNHL